MHINIEGWSGYFLGIIVSFILICLLIVGLVYSFLFLLEITAWALDRIKINLQTKRTLWVFIRNREKIEKIIKERKDFDNPFKDEDMGGVS